MSLLFHLTHLCPLLRIKVIHRPWNILPIAVSIALVLGSAILTVHYAAHCIHPIICNFMQFSVIRETLLECCTKQLSYNRSWNILPVAVSIELVLCRATVHTAVLTALQHVRHCTLHQYGSQEFAGVVFPVTMAPPRKSPGLDFKEVRGCV